MKSRFSKALILATAVVLLLAGCGKGKTASEPAAADSGSHSGSKLKVVATFYPMVEFSRQVAGEHADVVGLIPAGAEPHDWEPSAKDMALIKEADIFVYNGLVEGWADNALTSAPNEKRIVVEAIHGMTLMKGEAEDHEEEGAEGDAGHGKEEEHGEVLDPHIWQSPVLAQKVVAAIRDALIQADPANADDYRKNADAYNAKLQELDKEFRAGLDGLTGVKRKEFVTQHAAFGYLAKEYGLTQVPIAGLSPDQEPSPAHMAEIVKFAKEHDVKTIFFETLVEPKIAETIASEIGAKTDVLNPLEGLTDDEVKQGLDYIGIMKNNLAALKKALNE
ncbi:zinc ABC transporter substrate-binding protein [Cohnella sp. CFH 77786]|uniref:metal ABC transporter substrate-binding protein n=1 Tax=Cohnella sp. CFH 77786 TaxID=2662265 RepID=UPI001C60B968|nr:metal ABC transporter substrate-binding protein [Cohnella sp. CFH 77786]MBW5446374.1 zinc ABC transporter substrate-binding protein [Cohnella sp. CFH 77786]